MTAAATDDTPLIGPAPPDAMAQDAAAAATLRRLAAADSDDDAEEIPTSAAAPLFAWPERLVVLLALVKVVGGAMMWGHAAFASRSFAPFIGPAPLQAAAFGIAGGVLLTANARDRRTARLGAVLVIIASAFAAGPFAGLARLAPMAAVAVPFYPDALLPFFLARFLEEFPRPLHGLSRGPLMRGVVRLTMTVGVVLFIANLWLGWALLFPMLPTIHLLHFFNRRQENSNFYWTTVFGLMLVLLPLLVIRARRASAEERRRVRVFLAGFVVGFAPITLVIVASAVPALNHLIARWALSVRLNLAVQLALACLPITVAYSVLVTRVLPVRVVIGNALRYALARWLVAAAFGVPVALLAAEMYVHRRETIADAFSGGAFWLLLGVVVAGVVLAFRETLLRSIDRWCRRDAYDARNVLIELGEQSRRAHRLDELVALLTSGIHRALQPETAAVLVRDEPGGHFVSLFGTVDPLPTSSVLADTLRMLGAPCEVHLGNRHSPLRLLPRRERQWLVDSGARLLVPMQNVGGALVGLMVLGDRRGELPFSREDCRLLTAIGDAGALTIENHAMRASFGGDLGPQSWWRVELDTSSARAVECGRCGRVFDHTTERCSACGGVLHPADVPHVLFGKFRFEARVGAGGMGVVYRATDLTLDRLVAVKTLPGTSPEHSERLRAEAKAMAAVTHRNLAMVYGAETWQGKPMLVCEFMRHGTLVDRLARGPLTASQALSLGTMLAEALEAIHGAGFLHRDIKPSNIGYVTESVPKLLDFGLVHMFTSGPTPMAYAAPMLPGADDAQGALRLTQPLVGTPLYLSPEAIAGAPPTPLYDFWSLHVLLLEAITGQHPFRGRTLEETLDRIQRAEASAALDQVRGRHPDVAAYFTRALARDPSRRPAGAREVANALDGLRTRLQY